MTRAHCHPLPGLALRFAIAVAFVATWAAASPARAGGDVGVIVTGDGAIQPQISAQIADWLGRHGHTVVASPLPADAIPQLVDCFVVEKLDCARDLVESRAKSTSMVYTRIESETAADGRNVTLTAYWFDKGHDARAERQSCTRCTTQALRAATDEVMKKLIGNEGHVKLKSTPAGARIVIDGQPIGVTPLDWDLTPGKHVIAMDKAGLEPASREVVVISDKTAVVELALVPPAPPSQLWSHHIPLGMAIGGGALLATGALMIVFDQDPGPHEPATIHNTGPTGAALAITGLALGGAGAYLLWFRSPKATSAPVAAFSSDTAYVGWTGQF